MESMSNFEMLREAMVWDRVASAVMLALVPALCSLVWQSLQRLQLQQAFGRHLNRRVRWLAGVVDRDLSLTIAEYEGGGRITKRSDVYEEVKAYLGASCSRDARRLRAEGARAATGELLLSMDGGQEVTDVVRPGVTVWWSAHTRMHPTTSWMGGGGQEERHSYELHFHERHRELVLGTYLPRVQEQGRAIMARSRQRRLYTNSSDYCGRWLHVPFDHPKTFATVAMDPAKKKEIMDDLDKFKSGRDEYARVGKPWRRGYLLHGPPGTGKSSLIAAMAGHLGYDVYVLQLASVKSDSDLLKLFLDIKDKAIIVFEDIDCSANLTGKRVPEDGKDKKDGSSAVQEDTTSSKVTLSGVLNFVDGLWSASGEERVIVFTTNHVEKLDPALIRRGRMDKHIEMSYCSFEAFKFLLKMYHGVESHELCGAVSELLKEADMTPADVIEHLTPKSEDDNVTSCLKSLVTALEEAKKDKAKGGTPVFDP